MRDDGLLYRLDAAVDRGLLGRGTAHRIALVAGMRNAVPSDASSSAVFSGEEWGRVLGLSRAAIHKHVEHLRSVGFVITSVPRGGYRLDHPFDDLVVAEAVLPFVLGAFGPGATQSDASGPGTAGVVGLPYLYLPACGSTNQVLKQKATSFPSGTVMVTDEQTEGRGRLGRTWVSRAGEDLTFSVLLHPPLAPARAHLLSLAAALAVAEVLETIPGLEGEVGIKWPNDVLLGADKVCGILLEGAMDADRLQWAVAGIGLNVNSAPAELLGTLVPEARDEWLGRLRPTSLRARLGHEVPRAPLLAALFARLAVHWTGLGDEGTVAALLAGLRQRDVLAGRVVEVLSGPPENRLVVAGKAAGIGRDGQLLVRNEAAEVVAVFAGDVSVRSAGGAVC